MSDKKVIAVRVRLDEISDPDFDAWADKLFNKLRAAGIPVLRNGMVERGTIRRYDDPKSWDSVIYEWWDEGFTPTVMD